MALRYIETAAVLHVDFTVVLAFVMYSIGNKMVHNVADCFD